MCPSGLAGPHRDLCGGGRGQRTVAFAAVLMLPLFFGILECCALAIEQVALDSAATRVPTGWTRSSSSTPRRSSALVRSASHVRRGRTSPRRRALASRRRRGGGQGPIQGPSPRRSAVRWRSGARRAEARAGVVALGGEPWSGSVDELVARLRARRPLPALFPERPWRPWDPDAHRALSEGVFPLAGGERGVAVRAGLLLWNDGLAESHTVAQGITTPTGSYWHAIMHRREDDLDNSAHWFRRTGAHPAFAQVYRRATAAAEGSRWAADLATAGRWDPFVFNAWCGQTREDGPDREALERIQAAEMDALLEYCRRELVG